MRFQLLLAAVFMVLADNSNAQLSDTQKKKEAAKWRYDRLKDEQGNFNAGYAAGALQQADGAGSVSRSGGLGLQWQELGPVNVGGYMNALLIDKRDTTNNTLYAGSFGGGVWKSTDGAASWHRLTGWNQWLAISCIEQAPAPDYTIYVGTGNGLAQPTGSSYNIGHYGNGIFKLDSNDAPVSITPTIFTGNLYYPVVSTPWAYVNTIAVSQSNPIQVLAGTMSGIYRSNDAGVTWAIVQFSGSLSLFTHQPVNEIKWSKDGNNIFADVGYNAGSTSVLYSNDGGINWSLESSTANSGYPSGSLGRISLAIAPSNSNVVYALAAATNSCAKGLYISGDAGHTWTAVALGGDTFVVFGQGGCQGWYDNVMAVSSVDPDKTYLGGVDLYTASTTFGVFQASVGGANESSPYFIAPDIKSITIAENNADLMYICSDGGVFKSTNALSAFPAPTYLSRNYGLGVQLNYGVGAGINGDVIGGTESNGTFYINFQGVDPGYAQVAIPGDGILNAVSQIDTNTWFGGTYFGELLRSTNHCSSFSGFFDLTVDPFSMGNPTVCGNTGYGNAQFITPFYLGETRNAVHGMRKVPFVANRGFVAGEVAEIRSATANAPFDITLSQNVNAGDTILVDDPIRSRLFLATNCGVFLTSEALTKTSIPKWFKLSSAMSGTAESFVTTSDGNALYLGTSTGTVYKFSNLNAHADTVVYPAGDTAGILYRTGSADIFNITVASGRSIEGIDVDPTDNNHVVAVVAGFSSSVGTPHVYETFDGGLTWVADSAGLPNMPVYSVVIHDSHTIIIGTEFGIWSWDGTSWHEDNGSFERVPVYRMIERPLYKDGCNVVYLASSGRGMWRCTTLTPSNCNTSINTAVNEVMAEGNNSIKVFPNPVADQFKISLNLYRSSSVVIRVFDLAGRLLFEKPFVNAAAGENIFNMDAVGMSNGTYIVTANLSGEQTLRELFIIAR